VVIETGNEARDMDEASISLAAIYGTGRLEHDVPAKMVYDLGSRVHYWMVEPGTAKLGGGRKPL
jgi:hypothetical protein